MLLMRCQRCFEAGVVAVIRRHCCRQGIDIDRGVGGSAADQGIVAGVAEIGALRRIEASVTGGEGGELGGGVPQGVRICRLLGDLD